MAEQKQGWFQRLTSGLSRSSQAMTQQVTEIFRKPLDQAQLAQNVGGIVEMIKNSVDPMSWQGQGGQGSIGFNIPTMSLIIRQSAEVHAVLRGGLLR